jgi:transcriptional regulator with XRE-family HTH domain
VISERLRAARIRRGLTREALASRTGVSVAAIVQIENGRRQDVRLSTLSALAAGLGVSIDYLGGRAAAADALDHSALAYRSTEEFLRFAVPFLEEGRRRGESLLVVTDGDKSRRLRRVLGPGAEAVSFASSADWYSTPPAALRRYRAYVDERVDEGAAWVRVIGEPVWAGRSPAEVSAWVRYESLINVALASAPATVVCPYDAGALAADLLTRAHRTHPAVTADGRQGPSARYQDPAAFLLDASA